MSSRVTRRAALLSGFVFLATAAEVAARAWGWARRLPVNQYSDADIEILKQVMDDALENGANEQAFEWRNPETGHHGIIAPLTDTEQAGRRCRQTRFTSFTESEPAVTEFLLCQQPDGSWAVDQPQ